MSMLTRSNSRTEVVYRFRGQLSDPYPVGLFPHGIEFHNDWEGEVVGGPLAGGRIFGLDKFTVRPDGVGVIDSPEVIELGDVRVAAEVRGYVTPPDGLELPPLETMLEPGFSFPDLEFRVTASTLFRTAHPEHLWLNRVVGINEGTVNLATGALDVEVRVADNR